MMQSVRNPQLPYSANLAGYVPATKAIRPARNEPSFPIMGYAYSKRAKNPYVHLLGQSPEQEFTLELSPNLELTGDWRVEGISVGKWRVSHIKITSATVHINARSINGGGRSRVFTLELITSRNDDPDFWRDLGVAFDRIRVLLPGKIELCE